MSSPRSMFTESIEDHLALKKQNAHLEPVMPIARYDVGDPLDRYPGGPVRAATDAEELPTAAPAGDEFAASAMSTTVTTTMASTETSVVEGEFRRPLEALNGMTPMLSLVEDLDEDDPAISDAFTLDDPFGAPLAGSSNAALASTYAETTSVMQQVEHTEASVVRFPGGVGPRDEVAVPAEGSAEDTGEQPIIVIDADEPLAPARSRSMEISSRREGKRPRFFGLGRRKKKEDAEGAGWFSDAPSDFNWD